MEQLFVFSNKLLYLLQLGLTSFQPHHMTSHEDALRYICHWVNLQNIFEVYNINS